MINEYKVTITYHTVHACNKKIFAASIDDAEKIAIRMFHDEYTKNCVDPEVENIELIEGES